MTCTIEHGNLLLTVTHVASQITHLMGAVHQIHDNWVASLRCFAQVDLFALNCTEPPAVDAMYGVDGAAARRHDRRLRQFLRHEQVSVKMHVATALHHTAQRRARVDASTQTDLLAAATCAAIAAPVPVFASTSRQNMQ